MKYRHAIVSSVDYSAEAVELLPADEAREHFVIHNASSALLYVKFGPGASQSDCSFVLHRDDTFYSPAEWLYAGQITGVWDTPLDPARPGAAKITVLR